MKQKINSKKEYHESMVTVYDLMNKGEKNLSQQELKQLSQLSVAVEIYEEEVLGLKSLKPPKSITESTTIYQAKNAIKSFIKTLPI